MKIIQMLKNECNVLFTYGTYDLEGKAYSNFYLSRTWNLSQDTLDPLPSNASIFVGRQ